MNKFLQVARLFAVIFLLILAPAFLFGVVGRWQVGFLAVGYFLFFLGTVWRVLRHGKLADREQDRQVQDRSGRAVGIVSLVGLIGVHWLALYEFSHSDGAGFSFVVGVAVVLVVVALVLSQSAIRTLGRFFDRLTIQAEHRLVTEGVYGLIRHPIYTSYILLFSGYCLLLGGVWSLGLLAVVCVIWFRSRIAREESMLFEQFGDAYEQYCAKTKRLIPYIY